MAQGVSLENPETKLKSDVALDIEKSKEKRDRCRPLTKIIIRRLPPSMTKEIFIEQISPIPNHDYLYFVRADLSLGTAAFSRAYINFANQEDIFTFKDQFDNYIFVDPKTGAEYAAVVEFSPFQRLPKKRLNRRKDIKANTIEDDPTYMSFLQSLEDDIKDKENSHTYDYSYQPPSAEDKITTTPLIEFLKQRRAEKQRNRDERKEDRRKKEREREIERRKIRDEEKRKKRPESKDSKESPGWKQVLRNSSNEKEKEAKPQPERRREDDRFKDKKFQDKYQNKTVAKPIQTGRQRLNDDGRKKTQNSEPMGSYSRRNPDPKKPANRYPERDTTNLGARNKEPRKSGREQERKNKDDVPKSMEAKLPKEDAKPVTAKTSETTFKVPFTKKTNQTRRFSLDEETPHLENTKFTTVKQLGRSAENLQKTKEVPSVPPKNRRLTDKQRRSSLESGKTEEETGGATMRRNLSLELESNALGGGEGLSQEESIESTCEEDEKKKKGSGRKTDSKRRIRNKDRPSIEIYRPGMGRFSKQRIERDKD